MKIGLIFCLVIAFAFASANETDLTQKRVEVLQVLAKKNQLRAGTCREFADVILGKLGLPLLGKTGVAPSSVNRGSFDRSKESNPFPILRDEIKATSRSPVSAKLVTEQPSAHEWSLRINRSYGLPVTAQADSLFEFTSEDTSGTGNCKLRDFHFYVAPMPGRPVPAKSRSPISVEDCLDLYLETGRLKNENAATQAMNWAKADCALTIQYSDHSRELLKQAP